MVYLRDQNKKETPVKEEEKLEEIVDDDAVINIIQSMTINNTALTDLEK